MSATITASGRITRTPRTGTRSGGTGWATVAGALAYGVAWIMTVWIIAPLSYLGTFGVVRVFMFPVKVVWIITRVLTAPLWMPVRAWWRRRVAVRGSVIRKIHKRAGKGRRSAVRAAAELYRVGRSN